MSYLRQSKYFQSKKWGGMLHCMRASGSKKNEEARASVPQWNRRLWHEL